jgi:aminoglycoside phosphotransferase (APT) family kinase protein
VALEESSENDVAERSLSAWLTAHLGLDGPVEMHHLSGGHSNETLLLRNADRRWVVRQPPVHAIAPGAHDVARENRALTALWRAGCPVPKPLAFAEPPVLDRPTLVMEFVDGPVLTESLPEGYPGPPEALGAIGYDLMEALARIHSVEWQFAGLGDFGRPNGYLERQVSRWQRQFRSHQVRELPAFDAVGTWLESKRPVGSNPTIIHGDFHLGNTIFSATTPKLEAVIDFELCSIGDPLVDLGLVLAFWGSDRLDPPAMPEVQALSRSVDAPSRTQLADAYSELSGNSVDHLNWYMVLALWKLAAIVEGAYALSISGKDASDHAQSLKFDVPRLLDEALELVYQ